MSRNSSAWSPKVIGLSLDYDGCMNPQNLDPLLQHIHTLLTRYPNATLKLFVGSLRNTRYINAMNEQENRNGCCFTFMVLLEQTLKARHPNRNIELVKLLVEDVEREEPDGTNFNKGLKLTQREKEWLANMDNPPRIAWHDAKKHAQVYLQLHTLGGNVLYEHIDDNMEILKSLAQLFGVLQHDWIPRKTVFQLRQMIDGDFTAKKFTPIVSTGTIVDHCPRKTVKILQDRATAELCRYRVKTEVELLPLVANPHPLLQRLASTQSVAALIAIVATTSNAAKRKALRNALLHVAIERNQPRHIDQLLTLGAQQSHKIQQKTPIMLAAEKKHWEIVAILAKYPTDPNDRAQYSIALVAVAEHREQMALAIQLAKQIQNPILRLRHEGDNNRSALYFAIYYQSDALLEAILAEQNPDDTEFSEKLLLAFEYAFKYQNANAIKRLMVFCRDPINLLMRATTLAEEAGNWAIFNIVYDFVQSKKIVLPQEILIDLLPKLMMKNDAQLIASLLKNNTTFPVEEKNALDNMMQKFNETKESGRLTKTLLVELLQIIHRAVPAISAHHQKLHQLYTQTCALPENTFTPNAVTALFTILEEIAQKRWENIASLLDYLMLITLCETREIKAVQAITADIMSHYNPELKIKKLYGCFLAYQCVMHGFSGSITRHEPVAFILAHLNHDDHFFITQYVSENFVSAKKTTPLLNKLQNHSAQIDKKQTACLNAYRALRMAVLERNPTTPAEFSQVVADWKKAPNDFFMQKTNGAVLRESDDMQNSGCCGLFEPPSHGGFLLGLSRSFTDTANRALVGTAYVN